tara:strand:- start:31 stop:849 length:819 start_codon:yes stop_codon:yes gene_type:complete
MDSKLPFSSKIKTARRYYDATEDSYLNLCPQQTSMMNMGLWPSETLEEAQQKLIIKTILYFKEQTSTTPQMILEAGSGWGGTRRFFQEAFPDTPYIGVNQSKEQILHAEKFNSGIEHTRYLESYIENVIEKLPLNQTYDTFFSIEAAFHFEEKDTLYSQFINNGTNNFVLAEICLSSRQSIAKERLLRSALNQAWTKKEYLSFFTEKGFEHQCTDISSDVFEGIAQYTQTVSPTEFKGDKRVLRQLAESFNLMHKLAENGQIQYHLFHFWRK